MITIIKREFLDHLQSIQFVVLLSFSIVLFFANGLIFVKKFNQQITWYNYKVDETYQNPSTVSTMLYVRLSPLSFVSEGGDKYRPSGYNLTAKGVLSPLPAGPRNFKLPEIPELDWAFIIKIVFSLYVLLLGYDAISGEKEQGTLRQTLSHSIGRLRLLVAKYLAILLTMLVPLILGILISLIIVGVSIPQVLTLSNLSRILLMLLLALIYFSIFAFLSLLISSAIHQSSLVLLILLAIWVLFAIIIPNISGVLSEEFAKVPSEYQTAKQVGPMIQQLVWKKIEAIRKKVEQGELKKEEKVKHEADRAYDEGQRELIKHYESYEQVMKQRAATARSLSRLSPTALLQYASEILAETGTYREEKFIRDAQAYAGIYDNYVLKKVGKLIGTSGWSFATNIEVDGKLVHISSPYPEEYQGDKSDFPRFVESRPSITRSLRNALFDSAVLILWNLILAILAFHAFIRSDVR